MHTSLIETARVADAASRGAARRSRLHVATSSQAAYDLATKLYRKAGPKTADAALSLCVLARMDLNEQVERLRNNGELLHFGALVLA